jgi:hypothetical protein
MYSRLLLILIAAIAIPRNHAFLASAPRVNAGVKGLQSSVLEELTTVGEGLSSGSADTLDLPPLLQDMVKERRTFEMNLGKAMDVLRKDYPYMLHKTPGKIG